MIVVNATVLSNLARVDRIRILQELFGQIIVPMQVYEEILRGIEAGYAFLGLHGSQWVACKVLCSLRKRERRDHRRSRAVNSLPLDGGELERG